MRLAKRHEDREENERAFTLAPRLRCHRRYDRLQQRFRQQRRRHNRSDTTRRGTNCRAWMGARGSCRNEDWDKDVWTAHLMTQKYQCCFCGKNIPPISPDVGALLYYAHADRGREEQRDQQFWCHTKCLSERLMPPARLYLSDFGPRVENRTSQDDNGGH